MLLQRADAFNCGHEGTLPMNTGHTGEKKSRSTLLEGQKHVLEMINDDDFFSLSEVLDEICRVVESQSEGMFCSVLLLDEAGEHLLHGGAASLPEDYCKAIDGISIREGVCSCGTAATTGKPCFVEDITTHPYWAAFKELAHDTHGLSACWSTPIRAYDGKVVATFAMYHNVPKKPTLKERKLIDFSQHLVAIAVNRHREMHELKGAQT